MGSHGSPLRVISFVHLRLSSAFPPLQVFRLQGKLALDPVRWFCLSSKMIRLRSLGRGHWRRRVIPRNSRIVPQAGHTISVLPVSK